MDIKICQTIKKLRLSNNISQDTLANALGISAQAVSKWENLKALPDITLLPDIADFFKVSIDTLFAGSRQNDLADFKISENERYVYLFVG